MRILLVMPDYGKKDYYYISMGIMMVSAYLKNKGYEVHCLNQNHHSESRLQAMLEERSFDVVATGGLFIYISPIRAIINTVRRINPKAKVVLGGAIASADPQFISGELNPDFLVIGEAERTMDILLSALQNEKDLRQVTGIAFQDKGEFVRTKPTPLIEDLDEIPLSDYEGFEYGYYLDHFSPDTQYLCSVRGNGYKVRGVNIFSSRDCVSKCTFCFRITGGNYRTRSLKNFLEEVQYLIDTYNINNIGLLDEMFITSRKRLVEWCKALKEIGLPWECQTRVTSVDSETLALIKDSGCHLISFGFESGSLTVLKSMRKGITPALIEKAIQGALKHKITIQGNFIFGDPAETFKTANETIAFTRKFPQLALGYGFIIPYPGSELYNNLVADGKLINRKLFHENPLHKVYNMTTLSSIAFRYLLIKVNSEGYRRRCMVYGKILKLKKNGDAYLLVIRCHRCGGENPDCLIDLNRRNLFIVCKHCYQRTFIDKADIRFMNPHEIWKKLWLVYIIPFMISVGIAWIYAWIYCFIRRSRASIFRDGRG
ncbi:MAG: radical SAM protein [Candidatus Omnitrophota bacterium]